MSDNKNGADNKVDMSLLGQAREMANNFFRQTRIISQIPNLEIAQRQPFIDSFPQRDPSAARNMQSPQDIIDFNKESGPNQTLSADWRAVTMSISPLVPQGGTVVDVGGNNGQYARFLALSRPDVKIIAIESDPIRYQQAVENLKKDGLQDRVELRRGPLESALAKIEKDGTKVDAISSIYRTHLQSDKENRADMAAIGNLAEKTGASVLMHDLHRPKLEAAINIMTQIYPADEATQHFRDGYGASLKSSYRDGEMRQMLAETMGNHGDRWVHRPAALMGAAQVQMHILEGTNKPDSEATPNPTFPPTPNEYVKLGQTMHDIMKDGEERGSAPTGGFTALAQKKEVPQPTATLELAAEAVTPVKPSKKPATGPKSPGG
jgi:FkbM family methyltransferase